MYRARVEAYFCVSVGKLTLLDNCILKSYVKVKDFFMLEGAGILIPGSLKPFL